MRRVISRIWLLWWKSNKKTRKGTYDLWFYGIQYTYRYTIYKVEKIHTKKARVEMMLDFFSGETQSILYYDENYILHVVLIRDWVLLLRPIWFYFMVDNITQQRS